MTRVLGLGGADTLATATGRNTHSLVAVTYMVHAAAPGRGGEPEDGHLRDCARHPGAEVPAWPIISDPANARHALNLVGELERATRRAGSKKKEVKDHLEEISAQLGESAPHFVPTFLEEGAHIFLGEANPTYAKQLFDLDREYERVHSLPIDPTRHRAAFEEFSAAGKAAALKPAEADELLLGAILGTRGFGRASRAFLTGIEASLIRYSRAPPEAWDALLSIIGSYPRELVDDLPPAALHQLQPRDAGVSALMRRYSREQAWKLLQAVTVEEKELLYLDRGLIRAQLRTISPELSEAVTRRVFAVIRLARHYSGLQRKAAGEHAPQTRPTATPVAPGISAGAERILNLSTHIEATAVWGATP
ncbi:hypothetical protein [Corynebacterium sp. A21]|uniref:hypothetical protein n=1 Tax=Corynebacterium sp. A21 TaxID=3457318 RepID=UPI003FD3AE80